MLNTTLLFVGATLLSQEMAPVVDKCRDTEPYTVPTRYEMPPGSDYDNVDGSLQLFTDIAMPCDGVVTGWLFVSRGYLISGLHLGIFRQISPPGSTFTARLVGDTYLGTAFTEDLNTWVRYVSDPPVRVLQGDFVGLYYDDRTRKEFYHVVPFKRTTTFESYANGTLPTVIMPLDNSTLLTGGIAHSKLMFRDARIPALSVIFQNSATVRVPVAMTTTTTTTTPNQMSNWLPSRSSSLVEIPDRQGGFGIPKPSDLVGFPDMSQGLAAPNKWGMHPIDFPLQPGRVPDRCLHRPIAYEKCGEFTERAYFDNAKELKCKPFWGCPSPDEGANNFNSLSECMARCGADAAPEAPAALPDDRVEEIWISPEVPLMAPPEPSPMSMLAKQPQQDVPQACTLLPDRRFPCLIISQRFYFNTTIGDCQAFFGCKSPSPLLLGNNFDSYQACSDFCIFVEFEAKPPVSTLPFREKPARAPAFLNRQPTPAFTHARNKPFGSRGQLPSAMSSLSTDWVFDDRREQMTRQLTQSLGPILTNLFSSGRSQAERTRLQ